MNKTPLYEKHIELNAKLVDFVDYKMPIQYSGITKEHLAVRESAGILFQETERKSFLNI